MNKQQEQLREEIDKAIKNNLQYSPNGYVEGIRSVALRDDLLSLFTKHYFELIGEDSNISYHDEEGVRYLHQDLQGSRMWEMGYNKAKAELRNKVKGDSQDE